MADEFVDYALDDTTVGATPEAVEFIAAHELASGVAEIIGKMRELMPSLADVEMEVLLDPDCDCDPELAIRALFPEGMTEEAMDVEMDGFDEAWWLDASSTWDYQIEVHDGWVA